MRARRPVFSAAATICERVFPGGKGGGQRIATVKRRCNLQAVPTFPGSVASRGRKTDALNQDDLDRERASRYLDRA